jgi:hypothetical protein
MRFRPINVALWNSKVFKPLTKDEKLVYLYLLSSPNSTSLGLFRAHPVALADELGLSLDEFTRAVEALQAAGLVYYDEPGRLWFIPAGLIAPTSPHTPRFWKSTFDELPESELKDRWLSSLAEICKGLKEGMMQAVLDVFPMASGMASGMASITNTNTNTIPEEKGGVGGKGEKEPQFHLEVLRQPCETVQPETPPRNADDNLAPVSAGASAYSADGIRLATLLFEQIVTQMPTSRLGALTPAERKRTLTQWAQPIELLLRKDRQEPSHVEEVILWCSCDDFWGSNILSGAKLRERFDALVLHMKRAKGGATHGKSHSRVTGDPGPRRDSNDYTELVGTSC